MSRYFLQACSDKLKREMTDFGFPPKFPEKEEKEEAKQVREIWNTVKPALTDTSRTVGGHRPLVSGYLATFSGRKCGIHLQEFDCTCMSFNFNWLSLYIYAATCIAPI